MAKLKLVEPERPGSPVQSDRSYLPVRNPAAGPSRPTIRAVKRQLVKLIAGKSLEIASEPPMHAAADETVLVNIGAHSGAIHHGTTCIRRDAAVAGVSDVRKPAPDSSQLAGQIQPCDVALRPCKKPRSAGKEVFVGGIQAYLRKLVAQ